jgi:zinc-binding alcohol dehydrogenase family protein
MKAVAYLQSLPIDHIEALLDADLPEPEPTGHDLRVRVAAVSVNPVDTKIRRGVKPAAGQPKVLGWDAVGVVDAVGDAVTLFKPGERVWYAGDITRAGSNAELQCVDERIVGRAPATLSDAQAAALPLTAITAWELLFDRFGVTPETRGTLLVVGGAGGVGSVLIQLARQLTGLAVVATASRPATQDWVRQLGAHQVVDHRQPLAAQVQRLVDGAQIAPVTHVASLTQTDQHWDQLVELLAPQGKIGLIDDPASPLDVMQLKRKSLSLHWELMFTRSLFHTADMQAQHELLNRVADLVDAGRVRSTLAQHFGTINAANLRRAHAQIESGTTRGKIVLEGF